MNNLLPPICPAIIVMAKAPRAGEVKTRLQPFLSGAQAAELAVCFLQDTIQNVRQLTENVIVAFSPPDARDAIKSILPEDLILIEQSGNDLSERLESAVRYAENQNFYPIIVIGADSPTLPAEYVQAAIASFNETGIALGATRDGGFYLIGLGKNHPQLFENIRWSSSSVFAQTKANAERLKLDLFRLPDWYDVDTPDDLFFLRNEIFKDEKAQKRAPKTFEWLKKNFRF